MGEPTAGRGSGVAPRRGPRVRGGPWLAAVLPGAPQLFAGRWGSGGAALAAWLGLLWVGARDTAALAAAFGGPWDARLAAGTVLLGPLCAWIWCRRDVRGTGSRTASGTSEWALAAKAFSGNRTAVAALMAVLGLYVVALVAPLVAPFDPTAQGDLVSQRLLSPSGVHLLGTDQYARDVLSRLLHGARISMTIGLAAAGIAVTLGTVVGAAAGYIGGWVDAVIMRFVDMVISFPRLVLLIAIVAVFEPGVLLITTVLGLTLWPRTARIVRGEILGLRERDFVQAARGLGFSRWRIIRRHLIPNAMGPVIVAAALGVGDTIVLEAGLSFLGLGVQPPTPSWGTMVADGRLHLMNAWWLSTFSGLAIVATVLAVNVVGDGLRDALDPRLRT